VVTVVLGDSDGTSTDRSTTFRVVTDPDGALRGYHAVDG